MNCKTSFQNIILNNPEKNIYFPTNNDNIYFSNVESKILITNYFKKQKKMHNNKKQSFSLKQLKKKNIQPTKQTITESSFISQSLYIPSCNKKKYILSESMPTYEKGGSINLRHSKFSKNVFLKIGKQLASNIQINNELQKKK